MFLLSIYQPPPPRDVTLRLSLSSQSFPAGKADSYLPLSPGFNTAFGGRESSMWTSSRETCWVQGTARDICETLPPSSSPGLGALPCFPSSEGSGPVPSTGHRQEETSSKHTADPVRVARDPWVSSPWGLPLGPSHSAQPPPPFTVSSVLLGLRPLHGTPMAGSLCASLLKGL